MRHQLVDDTLYVERDPKTGATLGIIGRCTCGWTTGHRFSRVIAAVVFADHQEAQRKRES